MKDETPFPSAWSWISIFLNVGAGEDFGINIRDLLKERNRGYMFSTAHAEFRILTDKLDSTEITKLLGLNPTRTWTIGDSIQNTKLKRKHNGWCFSTDEGELEKSVNSIIETMLPKTDVIERLIHTHNIIVLLSCVVYIEEDKEIPVVSFNPKTLLGLAKLNASLDVDIIR